MSPIVSAKLFISFCLIALFAAAAAQGQDSLPAIVTKAELNASSIIEPVVKVGHESKVKKSSEVSQPVPSTAAKTQARVNSPTGVVLRRRSKNRTAVTPRTVSPTVFQPAAVQNLQIENGAANSWGNRLELGVDSVYFHGDDSFTDFASSGRVWFGAQLDPVYSIRTRIWLQEYNTTQSFFQDTINVLPAPPTGSADAFTQNIDTEANSVDIELRRAAQIGRTGVEAFLGATYAEFDNLVTVVGTNVDLNTDEVSIFQADIESKLQGIGLNFGFDSLTPFRNAPQFGLVANLRGTVLGGNNNSIFNRQQRDFVPGPGNQLLLNAMESFTSNGTGGGNAWVGHAQVGIQFSQPVACCGGGTFTARGLFEFQTWNQEEVTVLVPNVGPAPIDFDTELIGFSFGIGFER